jgi:F-type H+-transporting ATPase subunit a
MFSPFEDSTMTSFNIFNFDMFYSSFVINPELTPFVVLLENIATLFVEFPWYYYATAIEIVPTLYCATKCANAASYFLGSLLFFSLVSYVATNAIIVNSERSAINENAFFIYLVSFFNKSMIFPYLGKAGKKYFSFFLYLFLFILFCNLFGLMPGCIAITSNLTVTFFLSSVSWLGIFFAGLYLHGIRFFSSFFPSKVPFALAPFLMCVELVSYFVRIASLSLRLFANIVAGHILLDTISLFFYYAVSTSTVSVNYGTTVCALVLLFLLSVMLVFELLIGILQAYIFVVLSIIYLRDSLELHV